MTFEELAARYPFLKDKAGLYAASGITALFPPQADAIAAGALDGHNVLMAVPTAAGKTLIAELCLLKHILERQGRCLYIVPLKALATEKYEEFRDRFRSFDIRVGLATGDTDVTHHYLSRYHILVATAEKVDALLRAKASWLLNSLHTVVLDEIHFLTDGARGPTLEILTARIRQLTPATQILALSATVPNADEIADWLKAKPVKSDWRPVPLQEGVYFNERIEFADKTTKLIREDLTDDIVNITLDTLRGGGQQLVFVNSRRSAQATARQLTRAAGPALSSDERTQLAEIAQQIAGRAADTTKICRALADVVRHGVAFHHAGLKPEQRRIVEKNFKSHLIKVICATPTLAAGVNLPARRTVLRDFKRFEDGSGSSYIPTSEYKQCAGRAGRPGYDTAGEAVIIAKAPAQIPLLFERYINAGPEAVTSKLGGESALRVHILASIAGGYVHDINSTLEFIGHTFLAHQKQTLNLLEIVGDVFDFLQTEGFIEKSGFRYFATRFGELTSRMYVDPMSAIILRDGLKVIDGGKSFSNAGLLHMMACCPDMPLLKVSKGELEDLERFASNCQDEFILNPENLPALGDFWYALSVVKTAMMLSRWTKEDREEKICDQFNIGPGDIYRHTEASRWLLHAAMVFADLFEFPKTTTVLDNLKARVRYGIKEELIELCRLKGIGRVRARQLFDKGCRHVCDIRALSLDDLADIPTIGRSLAEDIRRQLEEESAVSPRRELKALKSET